MMTPLHIDSQAAAKMSNSHDASSSEHEDADALEEEQEQKQEDPSSSLEVPPRKFKRAPPQPKAQIIAHLESIVHEVAEAMHAGNFDVTTAPWTQYFHPDFYAEVGLLANSLAKKKVSLSEFCQFISLRRENHPEWRMNVTGTSTTVNTRRGKAEVFCNMELVGMPVGIVRPSVASLGFECVEGKWLFTKWLSFRGLGDMNELSESYFGVMG